MSTVGENGIAVGLDQDEDASARARRIEEEWIDQHGAETLPEGRKLFIIKKCGVCACVWDMGEGLYQMHCICTLMCALRNVEQTMSALFSFFFVL